MNNIICIYHGNCADGFGSAWVVREFYGHDGVDYHAGVYGECAPDCKGKHVIMVDFSYKRDVLLAIAEEAESVLIIDHHKSAQAELVDLPDNVECHFDMEHSGVVLTWNYYFPSVPVPKLLSHIEDRDLWKFEIEGTKEIQAAVFSYPYEFHVWDELVYNTSLEDLYKEGKAIDRKHMKDINEFIKLASFRTTLAGYDVPILNVPYFYGSEAGHIMGKGEPFAVTYYDKDEVRVFGLRSDEGGVDVSKIAQKFGGGGHKHAAGFSVPFDKMKGDYLK